MMNNEGGAIVRKIFRLFLFSAFLLAMCLPMAVLSHDVEYILKVRVEVSVPKAGQTIRDLQVTTSTPGLRVTRVIAYYQGNRQYLLPDHQFEVGKAYDFRVDLATISDDYYIVDKTFSAVANGEATGWNSPNPQSVWVMALNMVTITNSASQVDISLPEPKMDGRIDASSAKSPASPVTIRTVWYDSKTGQPSTDTQFQAGKTYSALMYVTCVEGCTLTNNAKFSINGEAMTTKQIAGRGSDYIRIWSKDYVMSYTLSSITVDFPIPAIGQKPSDIPLTVVARDADGDVLDQMNAVKIAEAKWLSGEEEHVMQPNDIFRAGVNYVCRVRVESSEPTMWEVVGTTSMSVNGNMNTIGQQWGPSHYISRSPSFMPLVQVDKVDVAVSIPRVGEKVQDNAYLLATTDGTAVATYVWHRVVSNRESDELKPTSSFIVDSTYYLEVTIKPTEGYTLSPATSVTFNGVAARKYATRKAEEIECTSPSYDTSTSIDRVSISLASPADGQNVKEALPKSSSNEVQVSSVSWYIVHEGRTSNLLPEYGVFLAGETYYCTFTLIPANGYYFANRSEVTLNGRIETKNISTLSRNREISIQSETFAIPKTAGVAVPIIVVQPKSKLVYAGDSVILSIIATVSDAGVLSYQWYENTTEQNSGGTSLGSTGNGESFTAPSSAEGVKYYYCIVTNTLAAQTATVASDVVSVMNVSGVLQSIVAPKDITDLPNGTPKTVDGLRLPATVSVVTATGNFLADVAWNVGNSSYNASMKETQNVPIQGVVSLPQGVLNPNNVSLAVQVNVAVSAAAGTLEGEDPNLPTDPSTGDKSGNNSATTTIEFTIDSKVVVKNGTNLPEIDVPAMIINGRTMIPFRYFIETALGGVANFDASSYTITATVLGHTIVMVVDDTTIYVDGQPVELSQAPTIVDSRTLVPLRMIETIAKSVGWDPLTRKATIVL